jgi:uncharacterized protein YjbI with pentapeptide repeats
MLLGGMLLPACKQKNATTTHTRTSAMGKPLTPEELQLLTDIEFRRKRATGKAVKISNRIFREDIRFDPFEWENIDFENCDFLGCMMFNGALTNVSFSNCLFFANRWDGGKWDDVSFRDCAWRGPFDMGTRNGEKSLKFDDCEFVGATAEELGYGGKSDYFGGIGGTNGSVIFNKCKFERTYINGGRATQFRNCHMNDVVIDGKDGSSMLLEDVTGIELIDFGTKTGVFSTVIIKRSVFQHMLTFDNSKIESAVFHDVKANLDLSRVKARSVDLLRMTFLGSEKPEPGFRYGFTSESAKISELRIEDCTFQGYGASLFLSGEEDMAESNAKPKKKDHVNFYSTDVGSLSIRNTPINDGRFQHMHIGHLLLEDLHIGGADFSNGTIRKFVTRNVTSSGKINLEKTSIIEKSTQLALNTSSGTSKDR